MLQQRIIIGARIRELRKACGYSQAILAERMNISRTTVSKIESGSFAFSIDYLARFAWYLGFEIALLEQLET
jgi:transcriptional regulator with XRE-family HTH domain